MRCVVTGCAGFIGSHLCERLIYLGHEVIGIDCFTDFYPRKMKEENLNNLLKQSQFTFEAGDLLKMELRKVTAGIDCIFHLAAQAGVRNSWGRNFEIYVNNNILATQKLLEVARNLRIKKFIYASSSSVYGNAETFPTSEEVLPHPISPYGVSKLAGEHLCCLYAKNFGVPIVSLRYFSVYGPRQRPDMAFHKFINVLLEAKEITVYGDGNQTRDFTFVSDAVEGTILAMNSSRPGEIYNIGGGARITVSRTIEILQKLINKKVRVKHLEVQKGDVRNTCADITRAKEQLGYQPKVGLEEGLTRQIQSQKEI